MSESIVLHAKSRDQQGKGASRRLRKEGKVPTIIYGAGQEPRMVSLEHHKLLRFEQEESFFSSILKVDIDGSDEENVIIRDYQRDPVKPRILHVDLLRINMSEKLHTTVPLHFEGDDACPGIKEGGALQRLITEADIICLPTDLPEALVVDISAMGIGDSLHLSNIALPEGIELVVFSQIDDDATEEERAEVDYAVANMTAPRTEEEEESTEAPVAPETESENGSDADEDKSE